MNKSITIRKSKIDKKGVFASRDFRKGETVLRWNPRVLKKSEMEKLGKDQENYVYRAGNNKYYLMQSPEKFVNHSCEANTLAKGGSDIAARDIRKGEEITTDYGKSGQFDFKCKCGSKGCKRKA
ncbi:MAG: SET domain-containing protein [Parcubacteria group bacterium]|jgi:SET domain-containing protein